MQNIVLDSVDPMRRETLRHRIEDILAEGADPWGLPIKLD